MAHGSERHKRRRMYRSFDEDNLLMWLLNDISSHLDRFCSPARSFSSDASFIRKTFRFVKLNSTRSINVKNHSDGLDIFCSPKNELSQPYHSQCSLDTTKNTSLLKSYTVNILILLFCLVEIYVLFSMVMQTYVYFIKVDWIYVIRISLATIFVILIKNS